MSRTLDPQWIQAGRFVVVGLFNTAFSYAIYAVFLRLGLGYALANFLALVLSILVGFKLQGSLVFRNSDNRRLFRFVVAWALIYGFNIFVIARFLAMGFDAYASGALALPFTTVLSYLLQKFFVFHAYRVPSR